MNNLNPSEFSYTLDKKNYTADKLPAMLLKITMKATVPKGTIATVKFLLTEEMREDANYIFPSISQKFEIQECIMYKLSTTEVQSINTAGSQAQNTQLIGGVVYVVLYFMQMFGTMLSYSMLGASQMTETYRYINVQHPPNLQKVFEAKVVPDLIKTLGFGGTGEEGNSTSNNTTRMLSNRMMYTMDLPSNYITYEIIAEAYPNYLSHFIKLCVGIGVGYFMLFLRKKRDGLFNYETLIGKIFLIVYNMFI